jgi:hypothetical protein
LKHPNEDAKEQSPKRTTRPKNHKQLMGMPPIKPILAKEKEIYEFKCDEDFSCVRTTKIGKLGVYFHFFILVM